MYGILARTSDGGIEGVFTAQTADLLEAQVAPDDTTHEIVLAETLDETPRMLGERFKIVDHARVAKTEATLTADPSTFAADGTATCAVSVDPFSACTLQVNGTAFALTTSDPTLLLTS